MQINSGKYYRRYTIYNFFVIFGMYTDSIPHLWDTFTMFTMYAYIYFLTAYTFSSQAVLADKLLSVTTFCSLWHRARQ